MTLLHVFRHLSTRIPINRLGPQNRHRSALIADLSILRCLTRAFFESCSVTTGIPVSESMCISRRDRFSLIKPRWPSKLECLPIEFIVTNGEDLAFVDQDSVLRARGSLASRGGQEVVCPLRLWLLDETVVEGCSTEKKRAKRGHGSLCLRGKVKQDDG